MELADRLQVFVSSVMAAEDLSSTRAITQAAITSIQITRPWAFESTPAEPNTAETSYLRALTESDLVVLIVSNSHSHAVQNELDAAEEKSLPILAFVKALRPDEPVSPGREQVLSWLRSRVKYDSFTSDSDLAVKVTRSIAAELVRGYRKYRITQADVRELVEKAPPPRELLLREPHIGERSRLREVLQDLVQWYPNIDPWITKTLADIGSDSTIRIADVDGSVAGLAISREKEAGVRKFATIYVRPDFQGEAIGPHLIYQEVRRAASDRIRKAYVSFAEELRPAIGPILSRYGFVTEGISGGRYRQSSAEWIMGKSFEYRTVPASDFAEFVQVNLIEQFGGEVIDALDPQSSRVILPATGLFGVPSQQEFILVTSVSPSPESEYESWAERIGGGSWLFVSMYGRLADRSSSSFNVPNWIDGEQLSARFYPVKFEVPSQPSVICTIQQRYADQLIPSLEKPSLLPLTRVQLRPDNVYYRAPDRFQQLRRGSRILFYVSEPESRLRGSARLQELTVGTPEQCLSLYGTQGVCRFDDLVRTTNSVGNLLALKFDWYSEYANKLKLDTIRTHVPNFNPITAVSISYSQGEALDGESGRL